MRDFTLKSIRQEKAYSSFNISVEGLTLPKSRPTPKEYDDSATRPLFRFLLLFKKIYFDYGVVKRLIAMPLLTIKTIIMRN